MPVSTSLPGSPPSCTTGVASSAKSGTHCWSASDLIANVFTQVIDVTGLLYAGFYILTGLAAVMYYRRRVFSKVGDTLLVGILPLAAAGFLVWIVVKSLQAAPA